MTDPTTAPGASERIQEKIKSLLRLAEDPGTTQEERDVAMERVYRLADKHRVDTAKLDPHSGQYQREDIVIHTFTYPTSYGLNTTRGYGVIEVLNAIGGRGYVRSIPHGKGEQEELVAYATESAMEILKVLLPSLMLQEVNAGIKYIAETRQEPSIAHIQRLITAMKNDGNDPKDFVRHLNSEIRTRRRSFCLAFYSEAAERIRLKRADAVQEAGRGYEVVLVDTAARIAQMFEELDGLRNARTGGQWSTHGWEHGSAAGRRAMVGQTEVHGGRLALE
jgi:hypothetical protein